MTDISCTLCTTSNSRNTFSQQLLNWLNTNMVFRRVVDRTSSKVMYQKKNRNSSFNYEWKNPFLINFIEYV